MQYKGILSLVLTATVLAGCSKKSGGPTGPGEMPGTPQTQVPAAYVGSWYTGNVSPSNFYNAGTGSWTSAYGSGMFYTFNANGTFEFGFQASSSLYGCTSIGMVYRRGTVAVSDSVIAVYDQYSRVMGQDNCNPQNNYEKPGTIMNETLIVESAVDDYGSPGLLIRGPNTGYCFFRRME